MCPPLRLLTPTWDSPQLEKRTNTDDIKQSVFHMNTLPREGVTVTEKEYCPISIFLFFRLQYANTTTVFSSYLRCSEQDSAIYIKFREISLNWMNMFFFKLSAPDQVPPHLESGTTSKTLLSSISHSVSAGTFRDILSLCIQLLSSNVTCSVFFNC